jgi:hypothetical protein
MTIGEVPVEVRTRVFVTTVFTATLPKLRLAALMASCGLGAGVPAPLKETTVGLPADELLLMSNCSRDLPVDVGLNCTCSVNDCVGANVTGKAPTTAKLVPVSVVELTVTGAVPVEVNVSDCAVEVFTVTLPKLRLPVLTVSWGLGAAILTPLRATSVVLPVDESLLIVNVPVALPIVVGLNCTCNVKDWVGESVTGRLPPVSAKPDPEMEAEFTMTGAVPVEVNVSDCAVEVFTVTLPKLRLPVLTVNWGLGPATLTPLRATSVVLPVDESLLIVNVPVALPTVVGLNCTCNVNDCVGASVTGRLPSTRVNPVPPTVAEFTMTGAVPVEVNVSDCAVEVFTVTLPKLRIPALTVS